MIKEFRQFCYRCRKAAVTCYCALVQPFPSNPRFVILIDREETKKRISTGRMAHLCLENSVFLEGVDFTQNEEVNSLLADPRYAPAVLYPTKTSVDLSTLDREEIETLFPRAKQPLFFIYDSTWARAKKMRKLSLNLLDLPAFSLTPRQLSRFKVRKQPRPLCLSTIEAIHDVIDIFHAPDRTERPHDNLLHVLDFLVTTQVKHEERTGKNGRNRQRNRPR